MSHSSTIRGILRGALLACGTVLAFWAFPAQAAESAIGKWDIVVDFQGQEFPSELTISEKADGSLKGVISSMQGDVEVPSITFEDGKITFTAVADAQGQEMEFTFEGTVKGDTLTGTFSSDFGEMDAEGTRAGAAPGAGSAEGIVGEWDLTSESQMGTFERKLIINPDLSGKYIGDIGEFDVENLEVDGSQVTFEVTIEFQGQELLLEFEGTLDGANLTGDFLVQGTPAAEVTAKKIVSASAEPPAIVGTWDVTTESQMGTFERKLIINSDLSGKYVGDIGEFDVEDLKVDGSQVTFLVTLEFQGQELPLEFEGTIEGETLTGEFLMDGAPAADVTAKKVVGPTASAEPPAIVGSWDVSGESPEGPFEAQLVIDADLSGRLITDEGDVAIENLEVDGSEVTFEMTINAQGQEILLEFEGAIDGDSLGGDFLVQGMPVVQLTGKRTGAAAGGGTMVGAWAIEADSMVGPLVQKMVVASDGAITFESDGVASEVTDLKVDGNKVTFNVDISGYALEFVGTLDGAKLTGDYLMGGDSVATVIATNTPSGGGGGGLGALTGAWDLVADSAVGPLEQKLTVAPDGSVTFESDGIASDVTDLKVDGNDVTFNVIIIGYDLEFEGTIEGSELIGDYLMGGSSVATVVGTKAGSGSSPASVTPAANLNISDLKGSWKLQAESAVGPLDQKLVVAADNSVTFDSNDVECEVTNFAVNGNKLTFNVTISGYDLEFEGTVEGADLDELNGDYLMGGNSVATVTGEKVE